METKTFKIQYNQDGYWFRPGTFGTETDARLYFWEQEQQDIWLKLHAEAQQGWRPISEVGPAAFKLRSYTKTRSTVTALDVVFWILTFFLLFLFQLLAGHLWTNDLYYAPVEFSVILAK